MSDRLAPYAFTVFLLAARTATVQSPARKNTAGFKGVALFLEITAASGTTPTLDVKIQVYDALAAQWHDVTGAAFAQKIAAGRDYLVLYPGVGEVANRFESQSLPLEWRVVATIGGTTPSFTFSLSANYLP